MNSEWIRRLVLYVLFLLVIQVPLLHDWVFAGVAFPFPYVGFLLLMPLSMGRVGLLIMAFCIGLVMDIFSSTPGMHASASVTVAFFRMSWFGVVIDVNDDDADMTLSHLRWANFTLALLPLIFVHHFILFALENEGFSRFWRLLGHSFWSAVLSYVLVLLVAMLVNPKKRR